MAGEVRSKRKERLANCTVSVANSILRCKRCVRNISKARLTQELQATALP